MASISEKKQNGLKEPAYDASRIKTLDLGVWKVLIYEDFVSIKAGWSKFISSLDGLALLVKDAFCLGPKPFISLILAKGIKALQPSLDLYQSSQFLKIVRLGSSLSTDCSIPVFRLNEDT